MFIKRAWDGLIRLCRKIPFVDKHWELWVYIFFGGLTTVFSWAVYFLFAYGLLPLWMPELSAPEGFLSFFFGGDNLRQTVANIISWVLSVAFAFFTNRAFVFHDGARGWKMLAKLGSFYASRLVSGLLFEILGFALLNGWLTSLGVPYADLIAKLVTSVLVIIANYFFSKLIIFRKKATAESDPFALPDDLLAPAPQSLSFRREGKDGFVLANAENAPLFTAHREDGAQYVFRNAATGNARRASLGTAGSARGVSLPEGTLNFTPLRAFALDGATNWETVALRGYTLSLLFRHRDQPLLELYRDGDLVAEITPIGYGKARTFHVDSRLLDYDTLMVVCLSALFAIPPKQWNNA